MKKLLLPVFLFALFSNIYSQQIRVMAYNLENYPNSRNGVSITAYEPLYKNIIRNISPDVIVAIEVVQDAGVNQFVNNVLTPAEYTAVQVDIAGTNSLGNDGNDCAFYYKHSVLKLADYKAIPARTRVISKFTLVHKTSNDTLIVFGVHLKANQYNSSDNNALNQQKRNDAVVALRNETKTYSAKTNYLVCGDFNIFSSNEVAFQKMLDNSSPGYFIDMLNVKGEWSGNAAFNNYCTHASDNLQTRLDMILISPSLMEPGGIDYRENSFKIFGNDGNHFGLAVNNGTNDWFVDNTGLGNALVSASDHLPIYADFNFEVTTTGISEEDNFPTSIRLDQNYPNPFNPETIISYNVQAAGHVTLKVYDLIGREIETLVNEFKQPGMYNSKFSIVNLPAGGQGSHLSSNVYFYQLKVGNFAQTKKMVYLK